ncbi:hypothetical protein R5R35_004966 [Gryllus longicercus]|uniref:Uncharacterized protein n=1 Tax=Gryllus longicercus TaxID=2509291 RepID=A0AAN9VTS9_9ORTH
MVGMSWRVWGPRFQAWWAGTGGVRLSPLDFLRMAIRLGAWGGARGWVERGGAGRGEARARWGRDGGGREAGRDEAAGVATTTFAASASSAASASVSATSSLAASASVAAAGCLCFSGAAPPARRAHGHRSAAPPLPPPPPPPPARLRTSRPPDLCARRRRLCLCLRFRLLRSLHLARLRTVTAPGNGRTDDYHLFLQQIRTHGVRMRRLRAAPAP